MNIRLILAVAAIFAAGPAVAEQESAGDSPSGHLHWELKKGGADGADIWISSAEKKDAAPVKLCGTEGWGNLEMHFSPDDVWILVQDGGGSLGFHLRLFRRTKGLEFSEQKQDIETQIESMAWKSAGLPGENILDHQYTRVLAWSADSKCVLIRTSGHGGKKRITGFTAVYDLGAKSFSLDLAKMNADAVETECR